MYTLPVISQDDFLDNMSHELRTPLNAILGFTKILLMHIPGELNPEQDKQLNIIDQNATILLLLINNLVDILKIDSGNVKIEHNKIDCNRLITEISLPFISLSESKGLSFNVTLPNKNITIYSDEKKLQQIIINILQNAVKFTLSGQINIQLKEEKINTNDFVIIRISDTGIGIKQEYQDKLFRVFTKINSESNIHNEGSGLGLYLSNQLAHLIGAKITFTSLYERGSTFSILLPVRDIA